MFKKELLKAYPEVTLLDQDNPEGLAIYLRKRHLIAPDEGLQKVEKPGEGNMNYTLRVTTDRQKFILKQARPWVEKYPKIAAPWDRVLYEARFYECVKEVMEVAGSMPRLLGIDPVSRVLACEDFGVSSDFTDLYTGEKLYLQELDELARWLSALHHLDFDQNIRSSLLNRDMRRLNHEHLFLFPLMKNNDLDLEAITPALEKEAEKLRENKTYVETIKKLGEIYLTDGFILLQGDFFPGSWLRTDKGVRIIDPEFCFFGKAEFDVGVMLAHLTLANQGPELYTRFLETYRPAEAFDYHLMEQFAGVEIMRRLIGMAQLPLSSGLERKVELLEISRRLVLDPGKNEIGGCPISS